MSSGIMLVNLLSYLGIRLIIKCFSQSKGTLLCSVPRWLQEWGVGLVHNTVPKWVGECAWMAHCELLYFLSPCLRL